MYNINSKINCLIENNITDKIEIINSNDNDKINKVKANDEELITLYEIKHKYKDVMSTINRIEDNQNNL